MQQFDSWDSPTETQQDVVGTMNKAWALKFS